VPKGYSVVITAAGAQDHPEGFTANHARGNKHCACVVAESLEREPQKIVIIFAGEPGTPTSENRTSHGTLVESVYVSPRVRGALISALWATGRIPVDGPIVVMGGNAQFSGDLKPLVENFLASERDAGVLTFRGEKAGWSYIETDSDGVALEVHEKVQVGTTASTGIVMFRSIGTFIAAAEWALVNNAETRGNFYLSSTLNYLISQGREIELIPVDAGLYQHDIYGEGG
jgi:hypothetical protein